MAHECLKCPCIDSTGRQGASSSVAQHDYIDDSSKRVFTNIVALLLLAILAHGAWALINDLRLNTPHIKCSVVMPGHIGRSIVSNTRKVQNGSDSDAFPTAPPLDAVGLFHRYSQSKIVVSIFPAIFRSMCAVTDCGHRRRNSDYGMSPRLAPPAKLCGFQKELAVARPRFRILIDCDDDRLDVLIAPSLSRGETTNFFERL
jgi:hypothetical protein